MKDKNLNESTENDYHKSEINQKNIKAALLTTLIVGILIAVGIVIALFISNRSPDDTAEYKTEILPAVNHESYSSGEAVRSFELLGIVYTTDSYSYAVISYDGRTYTVTEKEFVGRSSWQVVEIHENQVILSDGNGKRVLDFDDGSN